MITLLLDREVYVSLSQPIVVASPQYRMPENIPHLTQYLRGRFVISYEGETYAEPVFLVSDFLLLSPSPHPQWWREDRLTAGQKKSIPPIHINRDIVASVHPVGGAG